MAKIILETKKNPYQLMRNLGYVPQKRDKKTGEMSFVKRIRNLEYPRFHVYLKEKETDNNNKIIINLHIDQKKPVYKEAPSHAAEYEGRVVEKEAERIKKST